MDINLFQERIGYKGDISKLLELVVKDYSLGKYLTHKPILQGYEDFNILLETSQGKYLIKIMASFRSEDDVKQYAHVIRTAVDSGISHPKLYAGANGDLYRTVLDGISLRLVVMDFVDGNDFYTLHEKPTHEEIVFLCRQAAKINQLNLKPKFVYDSWAIPNFLKEYNAVKDKLERGDLEYIEPLARNFEKLNIEILPYCFVHGDIICTNVIRSKANGLYIIDFAVGNIYPRIQELAILLCDLLSISDKDKYLSNFNLALEEYQKITQLEKQETEMLPTFIKLAHAMHIIPAMREKINGTKLPENDFWLRSGQEGIRVASEIWK